MIRDMKMKDAEEIRRINAESLGYDVPIEITEKQMKKLVADDIHHILFVAEEDGKVAGYVHAEVYESLYSEPMLNILALAVDQDHQKKGNGKQLMQEIELAASERNLAGIRLNSGETRLGAHKFYESIGYSCDKTQKRFLKLFS
ncbi:GNAT family N-acetyltransferase [Carnobacterium sp.]|uniref:GNAT family N-acetyltransferase n=1 Tax=Carnobacterium sp. TaxID=48221 RepID=UPI0028AD8117|nr:GNAT family N-acetyltransferase [Carnobacterium sp.]